MKRSFLLVSMLVVCTLLVFVFSFTGCKGTTTTETTAAEATTVSESTAGETTAAETTVAETTAAEGQYDLFQSYMESAKSDQPFSGNPGDGKKLAFANWSKSVEFCKSVEDSIVAISKLAGFKSEDMIVLDNQTDVSIAFQNADIVLSKKVNGFIEFQVDAKANAIIGQKFNDAKIPVVAVDIAVPYAPFMGVNNYGAAVLTGNWIADEIEKKYGGLDKVDLIIIGMVKTGGEQTMLRSQGVYDALVTKYGADVEKKIVMDESGYTAETGQTFVSSVLAKYPNIKKVIISSISPMPAAGAITAVNAAGTIKREDLLMVSQGCSQQDIDMMRKGDLDASCAYFPEKYGQYLVPAITTLMQGGSVPVNIYVDNVMVTTENLDQYYPQK